MTLRSNRVVHHVSVSKRLHYTTSRLLGQVTQSITWLREQRTIRHRARLYSVDWCLHIRPDCCTWRHGFDTIVFGPTTSPCDRSVVPQTQITYAYYDLFIVDGSTAEIDGVKSAKASERCQQLQAGANRGSPPPSPSVSGYCGQTSALIRILST